VFLRVFVSSWLALRNKYHQDTKTQRKHEKQECELTYARSQTEWETISLVILPLRPFLGRLAGTLPAQSKLKAMSSGVSKKADRRHEAMYREIVPSGEGESLCGESSRALFLRSASHESGYLGSCNVVHRLDGSFPSQPPADGSRFNRPPSEHVIFFPESLSSTAVCLFGERLRKEICTLGAVTKERFWVIRRFLVVPAWTLVTPVAAFVVLAAVWTHALGWVLLPLVSVALVAAVLVGVHHAEVVAHRVGEPFGTLILAMAVTVIELGLIGSLMLSGSPAVSTLARNTVFATVMIVLNGVVGLCLLMGAMRHHVLAFRVQGAGHALSVLAPLTVLTLVLPTFTTTTIGPTYSPAQLAFAGVSSLVLYGAFVFVQTVRHRDDFLPVEAEAEGEHALPPTVSVALTSLTLLLVSLVAVVGLAKKLAPSIEAGVQAVAAPPAAVGIVIAMLVLLPETWAALRAAMRNRMQTSLNLALGSALATIGLTIPAVAALSVALELPLELGLPATETVLLALTLLVAAITLASGRATVLHGEVHLILFGAFLFLAVVP
jgi:Ca2+:H+ antiporter